MKGVAILIVLVLLLLFIGCWDVRQATSERRRQHERRLYAKGGCGRCGSRC